MGSWELLSNRRGAVQGAGRGQVAGRRQGAGRGVVVLIARVM